MKIYVLNPQSIEDDEELFLCHRVLYHCTNFYVFTIIIIITITIMRGVTLGRTPLVKWSPVVVLWRDLGWPCPLSIFQLTIFHWVFFNTLYWTKTQYETVVKIEDVLSGLFTITTKAFSDAVTTFHNLLNSIDPHVSFTIEQEHEGRLAFQDTLTTQNNGSITSDVHRKPTHTDRYLDYHSHHDKKHKISTAVTPLPQAPTLPNTEEGKIAVW